MLIHKANHVVTRPLIVGLLETLIPFAIPPLATKQLEFSPSDLKKAPFKMRFMHIFPFSLFI